MFCKNINKFSSKAVFLSLFACSLGAVDQKDMKVPLEVPSPSRDLSPSQEQRAPEPGDVGGTENPMAAKKTETAEDFVTETEKESEEEYFIGNPRGVQKEKDVITLKSEKNSYFDLDKFNVGNVFTERKYQNMKQRIYGLFEDMSAAVKAARAMGKFDPDLIKNGVRVLIPGATSRGRATPHEAKQLMRDLYHLIQSQDPVYKHFSIFFNKRNKGKQHNTLKGCFNSDRGELNKKIKDEIKSVLFQIIDGHESPGGNLDLNLSNILGAPWEECEGVGMDNFYKNKLYIDINNLSSLQFSDSVKQKIEYRLFKILHTMGKALASAGLAGAFDPESIKGLARNFVSGHDSVLNYIENRSHNCYLSRDKVLLFFEYLKEIQTHNEDYAPFDIFFNKKNINKISNIFSNLKEELSDKLQTKQNKVDLRRKIIKAMEEKICDLIDDHTAKRKERDPEISKKFKPLHTHQFFQKKLCLEKAHHGAVDHQENWDSLEEAKYDGDGKKFQPTPIQKLREDLQEGDSINRVSKKRIIKAYQKEDQLLNPIPQGINTGEKALQSVQNNAQREQREVSLKKKESLLDKVLPTLPGVAQFLPKKTPINGNFLPIQEIHKSQKIPMVENFVILEESHYGKKKQVVL